MKSTNWLNEKRLFEERVAKRETGRSELLADRSGTALVANSMMDGHSGDFAVSPYLKLVLSLGTTGRFLRQGDWGKAEGVLRPGTAVLAMPGSPASGYTPRGRMLGISFSAERAEGLLLPFGGFDALLPAASELHTDPIYEAVMIALWRDAEANGLASAFFEHGLGLILHRLATQRSHKPRARSVAPLSDKELQAAKDLIESRLGNDLRVDELAQLTGRDTRSLTRAFRAATGFAPYEYLTHRRMERAKHLLIGETTVLEIAMEVGYANPAKFSAAFKRFCGCSPSVWRRQARG